MDRYNEYDEMLDEIYGKINVCGLNYNASYVLKCVDLIAYEQGYHDFIDREYSNDEK